MAVFVTQDSIAIVVYRWYLAISWSCSRSASDTPGGSGSFPGRYTGATSGAFADMAVGFSVMTCAAQRKIPSNLANFEHVVCLAAPVARTAATTPRLTSRCDLNLDAWPSAAWRRCRLLQTKRTHMFRGGHIPLNLEVLRPAIQSRSSRLCSSIKRPLHPIE